MMRGYPLRFRRTDLLHIDNTAPVFGDIVQGELELLLAVASERSQHLRRETLIMHSDRHAFKTRQIPLPYVRVGINQPCSIAEQVARCKIVGETIVTAR